MDQIANMLIMIKNASLARKETVSFPYSKVKHAILNCLSKEGYITDVSKKTKKNFPILEATLLYKEEGPRIHDISRVSKPSRRVYMGVREIKSFKQGRGITVFSTPKGILIDKEARKELVGGEVLFTIW